LACARAAGTEPDTNVQNRKLFIRLPNGETHAAGQLYFDNRSYYQNLIENIGLSWLFCASKTFTRL